MAIGYAKLISRNPVSFFDNWIDDLRKNFNLYLKGSLNIEGFNGSGDEFLLGLKQVKDLFAENQNVYISVKNRYNNHLGCSLRIVNGYFIESYSMDEFLSDEDEEHLLIFLRERFDLLLNQKTGVGLIFDREGYSEDYIHIYPL